MIDYKSDTKKTLITVVNYDFYQGNDERKATQEKQNEDTKKNQLKTNNNEKELKNEKEVKPSLYRSFYDKESIPYQLSLRLFNKIRKNNEQFKEPNFQKWSDDFRLMIERDNRTVEQIEYVIDWCQNDSFWKANILSPSKLRKQFDQLTLKIKSEEQLRKGNTNLQQITLSRPSHWKEPDELTEDEIESLRAIQEELPY